MFDMFDMFDIFDIFDKFDKFDMFDMFNNLDKLDIKTSDDIKNFLEYIEDIDIKFIESVDNSQILDMYVTCSLITDNFM